MSGDGFTELAYASERAWLPPFLNSTDAPKSFQKVIILVVKKQPCESKGQGTTNGFRNTHLRTEIWL